MVPTIRDVAKKANVSVATVSRILNGLTGYSDKTKQKVLQTIEEMGYRPNAIARSLNNRRTQTIGVLFPAVSNEFSSALLHGIEEYAQGRHFSVLVCNTADDGNRTLSYLQVLHEKQVDGVIFASEVLREEYAKVLRKMDMPVVLLSSEAEHLGFPHVKVDDRRAAYDAVCYLISKGHREIAMISGTKGDPLAGTPRVEGYKQALTDNGLPFREDRVVYGNFSFESGINAMEALLKQAEGFSAVFAASDEMAVGALACASEHGISIPDDVSIIGYDNIRLSMMVQPPLTTVSQPLVEMGRSAAEKLIHMIEAGEMITSSIVPHQIVERQSVRSLHS